MSPSISLEYREFISNSNIDHLYIQYLNEFLEFILHKTSFNVHSIYLSGGLVRDKCIIKGWSDIDVIIIYKGSTFDDIVKLAEFISSAGKKYNIRLDVTQARLEELIDKNITRHYYNSFVINAIHNKDNSSLLVYGEKPVVDFSDEHVKISSMNYIHTTIYQLRRYLIETAIPNISENEHEILMRLTRWTFSIIRASLRIFDYYVHPYDDSIVVLEKIFPDLGTSILHKLVSLRNGEDQLGDDLFGIIECVDNFINVYYVLAYERI